MLLNGFSNSTNFICPFDQNTTKWLGLFGRVGILENTQRGTGSHELIVCLFVYLHTTPTGAATHKLCEI